MCWCDRQYCVTLKQTEIHDCPVHTLIGHKDAFLQLKGKPNPVTLLDVFLDVLFMVVKHYKLGHIKMLKQFRFDTAFIPGTYNKQCKDLAKKGKTVFCTFVEDGHFLSFQSLKEAYNLGYSDRYLQLRDYYNKEIKTTESNPNDI